MVAERLGREVKVRLGLDVDLVPIERRPEVMAILEEVVGDVRQGGFGASSE
jgi:hypothetical protein